MGSVVRTPLLSPHGVPHGNGELCWILLQILLLQLCYYNSYDVCHVQNPYHIKTEDDGPHGNDETRCFLLTSLSAQKVTSVSCVVCLASLYVYDKYPLIDGSFFLSPVKYNSDLQVMFEHRLLYLNAICMQYVTTTCHYYNNNRSTTTDTTTTLISALFACCTGMLLLHAITTTHH